ncbi:hypothetical protein M9H77_11365 [Catharanthus roseus]|uniref:Uncharacterized protein n=1 Tax=Catharanthus roseus TaxID=4058 RepID=A0ACC0BEE5_CATRO|nr:hypothetical protein M9H77_11365 [Catharanthus roseus]
MVEEPGSNCLHYLRKSHGLPCACELVNRCEYLIPIQEEDVDIFWRKLEICSDIPEEHDRDMESEMCDLTSLLQEISAGLISNVWKVRRFIKGVIHPVLPDNSCQQLEIGNSSGSGSGSGSSSGLGSNPSPRGRGRPPRSGRGRGRGRSSDGNCGFRVVTNFLFWDENHWVEIQSTTILPLISNMDGPSGTIFIGLIEELQHFIHLPGHYSHWEYSQDFESLVSAKVPRATVPRQKCSSRRTSYCSAGSVPPEAG